LAQLLGKGSAEDPRVRSVLNVESALLWTCHTSGGHPPTQTGSNRERSKSRNAQRTIPFPRLQSPQMFFSHRKTYFRRTNAKWRRSSKGAKKVGESLQAHL